MPIATGEAQQQTPQGLLLSAPVVAPGENLTAAGEGCPPGAEVEMSVGGASAGAVVADGAGGFEAPLSVGPTAVGRFQVTANCGPVLTAPLDVVLVSQAGGSTSTAIIVVFFLVMGLLIYRRRLLPVPN